jgi:hypothetical protein
VHCPHGTEPPQPSEIVPQLSAAGQLVRGWQGGVPQTLSVPPPPQVCPEGQELPQDTVPPQPSGTEPQLSPEGQLVIGLQPQTFAVPPPPHVWGLVHPG